MSVLSKRGEFDDGTMNRFFPSETYAKLGAEKDDVAEFRYPTRTIF